MDVSDITWISHGCHMDITGFVNAEFDLSIAVFCVHLYYRPNVVSSLFNLIFYWTLPKNCAAFKLYCYTVTNANPVPEAYTHSQILKVC